MREPRIVDRRSARIRSTRARAPARLGRHAGRAGARAKAARVIETLVQRPEYAAVRLIAAVSADVPLDDDELLLWGIFTRFDCARDIVPGAHRIARRVAHGARAARHRRDVEGRLSRSRSRICPT